MSFQPRDYQQHAIAAILGEYAKGVRSTLAVMPTGSGKTIVAAHVGDEMLDHGRVLVLAHRDELIRQAADKFLAVTGHAPSIEKGIERSEEGLSLQGKSRVVISSFQTQNSGPDGAKRMHRFNPLEFSLLWIDEAHHALAPSFRAVIDYYVQGNPALKVLGVTATPDRADGEAMGEVFQSVAYNYQLPDIIRDGYLVPIRQRSVVIDGLDFSKVRTTAGDLNAGDLEAAMMYEKPLHGVAHAVVEVSCGIEQGFLHSIKDREDRAAVVQATLAGKRRRKTLIFTVTVAHAQRMAEILNRWIPDSAMSLDGGTPEEKRRQVLLDYKAGKFQFLVNCMIASEGFDEPSIELIVQARPTKSRALFSQQIGRGTRPLDELAVLLGNFATSDERRQAIASSAKPFAEVLDFVGNSGRHKLISTADILGNGKYEEAVIELAKELAQEQSVDVEEALAEAAEEIETERQIQAVIDEQEHERLIAEAEHERIMESARRASLVGVTNYQIHDVDSFDAHAVSPERAAAVFRGGATDKQIDALVKLGVRRETAAQCGKRQAGAMIDKLRAKRCTVGQEKYLRFLGFTTEQIKAMNFDAASAAISAAKPKSTEAA